MSEQLTSENFEEYLDKLRSHIKKQQDSGKKVYLIALSRKMPRVINWALNYLPVNKREDFRKTVDNCIYTTELAIPIVFKEPLPDNAYILILDDIIIKGDTLRNAVNDIFYITGINPDVWCFCVFNGVFAPLNVGSIELACNKGLTKLEAIETLESISKLICQHELPTDIEYPILHCSKEALGGAESAEESFHKLWHSLTVDKINYTIPSEESNRIKSHIKSYNIVFNEGSYNPYCNDFAKLRIFEAYDEYRIASFAPNLLSESMLNDSNLFSNEKYAYIWNVIQQEILTWHSSKEKTQGYNEVNNIYIHLSEGFEYRRDRLRMVIACYLFSLSSAIRGLTEFTRENQLTSRWLFNAHISVRDFQLLVGEKLATRLQDKFEEIIRGKELSNSIRTYVVLPESIVDYPFFELYIKQKNDFAEKYAQDSFESGNSALYKCLRSIFKAGYEHGLNKELSPFSPLNYESSTQETIAGLIDALIIAYYKRNSNYSPEQAKLLLNKEINEWLDYYIDRGYVIPRYQRVTDGHHTFFWRRFFHASHLMGTH